MLKSLVKHKTLLSVASSVILAASMGSTILAQTTAAQTTQPVTFGLSYGASTGLGQQDVRTTISRIINVALSLLGIIALIIILAGGFQWMTAGGNEEKVTGARKMIFSGIIGLAIILSAFAIATFVLQQLANATVVNQSSSGL